MDANVLCSGFDKIRRGNWTIYINRDFRNSTFERLLTQGPEGLQKHCAATTVPSSESTNVCKFTVRFDGVDREVYLKQYAHGSIVHVIKQLLRTSRSRRAFEAMQMLAENGFKTPAIVAMGKQSFGLFYTRSFLATIAVRDSKSLYQSLSTGAGPLSKEELRTKRQLIRALGQTIGRMHAKGIFHGDLRVGNVLAKKGKNCWQFFFLDNERTRMLQNLPARLRVKNLVQVNMKLPETLSNTDRMRFFKEYWAENGGNKRQKTALINKILKRTGRRLSKKRQVSRELRKCLRTNAKYVRLKAGRNVAVFSRGRCQEAKLLDFVEQIDTLMDQGQVLKNGETCCVSRLRWSGNDVVVKRYNHKGLIHSLRHTIKRSRARRSWLQAHRLGVLDIATPRPLAYIEQHRSMLVWKSYLVTEYVEGRELKVFLRDDQIGDEKRATVAQQVKDLLGKLGQHHITHGDLKHSNVLITESGPVLTDLDAMTVHKWTWLFKVKRNKDMARLAKDWKSDRSKDGNAS